MPDLGQIVDRFRPSWWNYSPPPVNDQPDRIQGYPVDEAYKRGIQTTGSQGRVGPRDWLDTIAHALTGAAVMRGGVGDVGEQVVDAARKSFVARLEALRQQQ